MLDEWISLFFASLLLLWLVSTIVLFIVEAHLVRLLGASATACALFISGFTKDTSVLLSWELTTAFMFAGLLAGKTMLTTAEPFPDTPVGLFRYMLLTRLKRVGSLIVHGISLPTLLAVILPAIVFRWLRVLCTFSDASLYERCHAELPLTLLHLLMGFGLFVALSGYLADFAFEDALSLEDDETAEDPVDSADHDEPEDASSQDDDEEDIMAGYRIPPEVARGIAQGAQLVMAFVPSLGLAIGGLLIWGAGRIAIMFV